MVEEGGILKDMGPVDWNRSRFLEEEFYAWTGSTYYVLTSDKEIGLPPKPDIKWGPTVLPDGVKDEDDDS